MQFAKRHRKHSHSLHDHHKSAAKKPKVKNLYLWIAISGLFILWAIAGASTLLHATEGNVITQLQGNKIVPVQKSLTIYLNKDVKVSKAKITLTPADAFSYKFASGKFGQTTLTITPTKALRTNHEYKIEIRNLSHLISRREIPAQTFSFRTELAPGIAAFSPTQGLIGRTTVFTLVASDHATAQKGFALQIEPQTELQASFDNKTTWRWKPKQPLQQGVTYKLKLTANKKVLQEATLQTASEPKIVAASSKTNFHPDEKIAISFDKPMHTDQKDALIFPMSGSGEWLNNTNYIFTPKNLERNKEYTYTVKAGLASQDGGTIEADKSYKIRTPGPATVVGASPFGSGVSRGAAIRFSFDQEINHASTEAHFSITPATKGSFKWEGNTLVFVPAGYDWQTTYTATILPGVEAIFGVPGTQASSVRFTTEVQTIKLNTPIYRQTYKLSCEASALRMAMATFGTMSDDMTIVQRMGYTPRPMSNGQWDDPYSQFVGDINGKQWDKTGYGVYNFPVAAAARSFGRGATAMTGVSANWIAQQIHDGHPVVVWGYQYNPTLFTWTTPGGKTIQAWQGEHTRTVIGVVGTPSAPQGFYVADPAYGSASYISAGALMANMNVHGNLSNQAVVVF